MAWGEQGPLVERFDAVRECLQEVCPRWELGSSYEGWIDAQRREAERLLPHVIGRLRQLMSELGEHQRIGRWFAIAVDGSDGECPRTLAQQGASNDKGQPDGMPLLSMTTLYHLRLGLPWDFRVGSGRESERGHLREMLDELPAESLLVADAGFIGYDLCREMIEKRRHFLLRVGGNVRLLKTLGYDYEIDGQTVYLWPAEKEKQGAPPLQLRLIVISDPDKHVIFLVTSVLDAELLTADEAREIYYGRWGVELFYRDTKQTLDRDGVLSRRPDNGYLEMAWSLIGVWVLKLMTSRQLVSAGVEPRRVSVADARNVVRRAMRGAKRINRARGRQSLLEALTGCQIDGYRRTRPKASRNYPRKKRYKPPQPPKIQSPTPQQLQRAKQLTPLTIAP
jgi:hypothetical protein